MTSPKRLGLRLVSLMLCLVCLAGAVRPASAAEETQPPKTRTTIVRASAYSGATPIGQMTDGTEVTVLDSRGDYYMVDCYDMTGFIAKSQILHTKDGKYYVDCKKDSADTKVLTYTPRAEAMELRHGLLNLAKDQLGEPYIYGSIGSYGFDCSGLMYYLYQEFGISLHRTASQQLQDGIVVSKDGLQVGDLIFFREPWESYPASHVGIYAGNNKIIHASRTRGIEYADLDFDYFYENYLCARRVINTDPAKIAQPTENPQSLITRTGISGRTTR